MLYRLIILTGDRRGEHITVTEDPMIIGCGATCDVRIIDSEMAQAHAEIAHQPGGPTIHDLGSMNRILVNNHEVRQTVLKHGDILELGRTRFLVQVYVQADVAAGGEVDEQRRKWWPVAVGAAIVLLLILLAPFIYRWRHEVPKPSAPVVASVLRPKVPSGVPPAGRMAGPLATTSNVAPHVVTPPVAMVSNPVPPSARVNVEPNPSGTGAVRVAAAVPAATTAAVSTAAAPPPVHVEQTDRSAQDAEIAQAAAAIAESKARTLLAQVKDRMAQGDLDEAERILTEAFWFQPDYPPALEQRARLLERRGRLNEARQQWAALAASTNAAAASAALAEVTRIDLAREAAKPPAPVKRVHIDSAELSKFPATEAFSEMRLLTVRLSPTSDVLPDTGEVKAEFVFYERDPTTGAVLPAPDRGPREPIAAVGAWHEGEVKVVSASYTVPASAATNPPAFHGYVVRVFHHGVLQDAAAQPRDLMPSAAPAGPAAAPRVPAGSPGAG